MKDTNVIKIADLFYNAYTEAMNLSMPLDSKFIAASEAIASVSGILVSIIYFTDPSYFSAGDKGVETLANTFTKNILDKAREHIAKVHLLSMPTDGTC